MRTFRGIALCLASALGLSLTGSAWALVDVDPVQFLAAEKIINAASDPNRLRIDSSAQTLRPMVVYVYHDGGYLSHLSGTSDCFNCRSFHADDLALEHSLARSQGFRTKTPFILGITGYGTR